MSTRTRTEDGTASRSPSSPRRWSLPRLLRRRKPLTWLQVEGMLILALDEVSLEPAPGLQFQALAAIVVFQLRSAGVRVIDDRPLCFLCVGEPDGCPRCGNTGIDPDHAASAVAAGLSGVTA